MQRQPGLIAGRSALYPGGIGDFLADDLRRVGAAEDPLEFAHPLPAVAVSNAVAAAAPAERALGRAREAGSPGGAAGDVFAVVGVATLRHSARR